MLLAVAGCVAQAEGKEIVARQPAVDVVVGPQSYHRLPEMIAKVAREARVELETDFPAEDKFDHLPEEHAPRGPAAFLTVQEGCDKFCTFCVVPYTRGAEFSRPVEQITEEARRLVKTGTREITLLGQNVNAYSGEGPDGARWSLAKLIRHLVRVTGVERLRYTTSHPRDMGDDLIAAHGDVEQLMPFLHLPVQSGSDRVLRAMNRGHKCDDYLKLVERIRASRPDIALSSDFIVGFPRRDRCRFRSDARAGEARDLRAGLLLQVQRAARHACVRGVEAGPRRRKVGTAANPAGAIDRAKSRVQRSLHRQSSAGAVRKARPQTRSGRGPQSLSSACACR